MYITMCLYITITILLWVLSIYPVIMHYIIVILVIYWTVNYIIQSIFFISVISKNGDEVDIDRMVYLLSMGRMYIHNIYYMLCKKALDRVIYCTANLFVVTMVTTTILHKCTKLVNIWQRSYPFLNWIIDIEECHIEPWFVQFDLN